MQVCKGDRRIVQWAAEHGHLFRYVHQPRLPEPCLEVAVGFATAYFHDGKLVRFVGASEGDEIDQLMYDLTQLFSLCRRENAYLKQQPFLEQIKRSRLESA